MRKFLLPLLAGLCFAVTSPAAEGDVPDWANGVKITLPLNSKATGEFVISDPAVWKFAADENKKGFLQLDYDRKKYKSTYTPKHRSPIHIALLKQYPLTDFVMDVELMSTTEPYGHQDLCLFFGFESPEKYYYVHIAKEADMNAHNVFIVNKADRKNIAKETTKGVEWKKGTWHTVRLVRQASTGKIEVYFDDMKKPIMKAEDKTFQKGFAGFGSFDDTGRFRHVTLYTKNVTIDNQADFFKPLEKKK
ncbi:MAG: hypothetical protein L0241_27305 [Planctomycetia bacterium]|nr:hypothetical protein [Planctomycetia bacterium]